MARTTITQVTDDLDGSRDAEEVQFSFDGADYTIDLSKKNRTAFEKAIRPYLDAATKAPKRSAGRAATTKSSSRGRAATRSKSGVDLAAVREWAKAEGIEVSERGRVARSVLDQYTAATNS